MLICRLIAGFLLLTTISFGQVINNKVEINWSNNLIDPISNIAEFNFSNAQWADDQLYYVFTHRLDFIAKTSSVTIKPLESVSVSSRELRGVEGINTKLLFSAPNVKDLSGIEAGNTLLRFLINPFFKGVNGEVRKLLSFEINVEYEQSFEKNSKKRQTTESVLSSGKWYKLAVTETGIYKIDRNLLLEMGVNVNDIDPRKIKLYGNGGGMLPELNNKWYPDDLLENAIEVVGESDGDFNSSDHILFYGQGPIKWSKNGSEYIHQQNIYSDSTFYFLTVSESNGKRVSVLNSSMDPVTHVSTGFDDYAVFENEDRNLVKTGREWFGEYFDIQSSYNSVFSFPNIQKTEPVLIKTRFAARSTSPSTLNVKYSGQTISSLTAAKIALAYSANYYNTTSKIDTFLPSSNNIVLSSNYDKAGNPAAIAWLDYIALTVRRDLRFDNIPVFIRDSRTVGTNFISDFGIESVSSGTKIWDITNPWDAKSVNYDLQSTLARFILPTDSLKEFVVFKTSGLKKPKYIGSVKNQNLHGLADVEYVIITPTKFLEQADSLAGFHRRKFGTSTVVLSTKEIYNEFSGGAQDLMGIRKFLIHLASQSSINPPKNVLLFGDASYDFKNRVKPNHNQIVTYESTLSNNLSNSFVTDDAIAYFDSSEGVSFSTDILDIGVARVPINSTSEAQTIVNKVKTYASKDSFGPWRNKILLATDDVDEAWEQNFQIEADKNQASLTAKYPYLNFDKVYSDTYQQVVTAGGQRYPEARDAIDRGINDGVLVFNYIGHGGEVGLSQERIVELEDVINWTNKNSLAVFVTATCEFTRVDDPDRISAGEYLITNKKGGAIASFSTTRAVYANTAYRINSNFYDHAFENNGNYTFGEIMMRSKNDGLSVENAKFSLFGDPALTFAVPKYNINTTSVTVDDLETDTITALSKVIITGQIQGLDSNLKSDFNGLIYPVIYDKPTVVNALNNEKLDTDGPLGYAPFQTTLQKNILYKGKADVVNGQFQFSLVVPKDIAYAFGNGKISYYANNDSVDAKGYDNSIIIGGSSNNATEDNVGPEISLFMNNEQFVFGGLTDATPSLYALISDSNGVNTVGNGIGHDIVAILDEDQDNSIVLNEYYESDVNSYQSGKLNYPFSEIEKGRHTLTLKVWDVYNNSNESRTEFVVAESSEMALEHVLNYPNPFTTYTEFHFEHNRPSEPLQVQIQVFTVSGKLVKTIQKGINSSGYRVNDITWDGKDDFGDVIGKGVYVYRVKVKSETDNSVAEKYEKLVILR